MSLPEDFWPHLWGGFIGSLVFGLLGLLLILVGFKLFDLITPRIDIQKELAEKNNLAVAIVVASVIVGVSIFAAVTVK